MIALRLLVATSLTLGLPGCHSTANAPANTSGSGYSTRLLNAAKEPQNWLTHGGTYAEQRFSTLDQINAGNVGKLALAWSYDFDTSRGQEATPLIIDGVMYTTTAWSKVVALDAATGNELWKFDPKVPGKTGYNSCCDVVNRGAAYDNGKLFFGTLDGRLIALDAKTGAQLWSVVTVDQTKPYTITGAPRVVKGRVIIGNGGAEFGVRGYVSAYDENTGNLDWRFYTVPANPAAPADNAASDDVLKKVAAPTWFGKFWAAGGGGTVWDSIVYDPELDQLIVGVGNGSPWNREIRSQGKGDNLFLSSMLALNPDTGKYKWHYQETPGESWDFTATQQIILTTLTIDGKRRKVAMQAPKNGFFYVIDRINGKLISASKYVPANWASKIDSVSGRPVEDPASRYIDKPFLMSIGGAGGHNWQPMSYSPKTNLVYIPAQELPMMYSQDKAYSYSARHQNIGIDQNFAQIPATVAARKVIAGSLKGRLLAWDPVTQKTVWSVEYGGPWNGGTMVTAGDLVFQGTARGEFLAFQASTGKSLWRFSTHAGVMAGPVTFAVGRQQYVAVLAGYGGAVGLALPDFNGSHPQPPGRVLVFKLSGAAKLANDQQAPAPANPAAQQWDFATLARGDTLYALNCARCHALGNYSAGVVPDLRRSGALTDATVWKQIILDGVLQDQGMVSFRDQLSPTDVEAIRGYVSSNARQLQNEETTARK
jgi:PQQ-dependent dehydrogenase (methanol/ethanol family)